MAVLRPELRRASDHGPCISTKEEPRRGTLGYGDFDTVMNVLASAVAKGPYLMGEQFTAADVVVGSALRWGMMFNLLPERPEFVDYVATAREASGAPAGDGTRSGTRRGVTPWQAIGKSEF